MRICREFKNSVSTFVVVLFSYFFQQKKILLNYNFQSQIFQNLFSQFVTASWSAYKHSDFQQFLKRFVINTTRVFIIQSMISLESIDTSLATANMINEFVFGFSIRPDFWQKQCLQPLDDILRRVVTHIW